MELHAHEPGMIGPLDDLGQFAVGRHARKHQPATFQRRAVMDVHLVTVAMPLGNRVGAVDAGDMAVARQRGVVRAQPHRAAHIAARGARLQSGFRHPFGDEADDGFGGRAELGGGGSGQPGGIPRAFDAGHLHAEADPEIGHLALPREPHGGDLALRSAFAEAARHQDRMQRLQLSGQPVGILLEQLGIQPADMHLHPVGDPAMHQRLVERLVRILQADIFADHADRHLALGLLDPLDDLAPARQIERRGRIQPECIQHRTVQPLDMILQRHAVDRPGIQRGDHRFLAHVAEQRDLGTVAFGQRPFAPAHQHVGLDAERGEVAHAVLRRLGLQLARRRDIGHQRQMDERRPVAAQIVAQLADRLHERQRFDVAHRSADLAQHEIQPVGIGARKLLDRVGHVRDHLHGGTQIIAPPLLGDDRLIDPPRRHIVRLPARHAREAFIMAKVEVGLRAVVGHIDLAVLIGRHRARIDVQIGIELADADRITARLQESRKAGRHETLAE